MHAGRVSSEDTVAVVGSSHSAVLVLMNLLSMEPGPKVVNLYRSPLQYARFVNGGPPHGYIVRDNTGLKVRVGAATGAVQGCNLCKPCQECDCAFVCAAALPASLTAMCSCSRCTSSCEGSRLSKLLCHRALRQTGRESSWRQGTTRSRAGAVSSSLCALCLDQPAQLL